MASGKTFDVGAMGAYFESLSDPRHTRNRLHFLTDVIVICICAIVSHAPGPTAIHRWALARQDWLKRFLRLPNGIPSRDCIRRVLIALRPEAFQKCFEAWLQDIIEPEESGSPRFVAIDGKHCRGSHERSRGLGALDIVSAWDTELGIALGQAATEDKSNEITTIPLVLAELDLLNTIVTIDAIGCQKAIVEQIDKGRGAYVIAVKGNQPKLHEAVREVVADQIEKAQEEMNYQAYETKDEGHGRVDERAYGVVKLPADFPLKKDWRSIKAVGYATRHTIDKEGNESFDTRFYILNRRMRPKQFAQAVRGHWAIEAMHWVLDVNFREDEQQAAERNLVNNLSWLRRFAVSLLKRGQDPKKESIRGRMQMSGWNTDFLEKVLAGH